MTERKRLHPNFNVNLRKFAADERKTSEQGYVVKVGGVRKYFKSFREAQKYRDELVKGGEWKEHVHIINIAKQRDSPEKIKRYLSRNIGGHSFYGGGLTSDEIADMVLGRMGEATSHTFRSNFATIEIRKIAQRALRHMMQKGQGRMTPKVKKALELELHTVGERRP